MSKFDGGGLRKALDSLPGMRASRTARKEAKLRQRRRNRVSLMQQLEDRRMLAVLSQPSQPLPVVSSPVAVTLGTFTADGRVDAIAINAAGDATLATAAATDDWQTIGDVPTNFGDVQSVIASRLTADPLTDLITVSADAVRVWHNDGNGGFVNVQSLAAPSPGAFGNSATVAETIAVGFVDSDAIADLIVAVPATDSVLVYRGNVGGTFASSPDVYASGGDSPTSVVVADVIGGPLPDVVVGHADGSIVFFEGIASGTSSILLRRDELTIRETQAIVDLEAGDFDGDGNTDIVVTAASDAFVLFSSDDPQETSPIINGDFSTGLTGWTTEIIGQGAIGQGANNQGASGRPGRVNALGGAAQFTENESFLTSLKQTVVIPAGATTLSFDLVSLGLDPIAGGVPDAFEVSLLDADEQSIVATHDADSTAFFNVSSGRPVSLASGVTVNGGTVTLDVSGLAAGTSATLIFDLIGNPPGDGSVATVDNVRLNPEFVYSDLLTRIALAGTYGGVVDAEVGDVDGDGNLDVVLSSTATQSIVVFNGGGGRAFTEDNLSLSTYTSAPADISLAPLTAGDSADDIVVLLPGQNLVLSPLGADVTSPAVTLLSPDVTSSLTSFGGSFSIGFSEPVRVTGIGLVNNPSAYTVIGSGPDGVFGTGDDAVIAIDSVNHDPATLVATVAIASTALPLIDGNYRLILSGEDSATAIRDVAGNAIGGGSDVAFDFDIDAAMTIQPIPFQATGEGVPLTLSTTFADPGRAGGYTAIIGWGDGTQEAATVTVDASGFAGTITATHAWPDDTAYGVTIRLTDARGEVVSTSTLVTVANTPPSLTSLNDISATENVLTTFTLAQISDPAFAFGSRSETFTAVIDWGDGSPVTVIDDINETLAGPTGPTLATLVASHVFASEGVYTVTIVVTDDEGGSTTGTLKAFVSNTAPVLSPIDPVSAIEGQSVSVSGTYTDDDLIGGVDPSTIHTLTIDWGDGTVAAITPTAFAGQQAGYTADHVYADDGDYTIRVTVSDGDTGMASQTTIATIAGAAPVVSASSDTDAMAGQSKSFSLASFTDAGFTRVAAGTQETFSVIVDWGDGGPITVDPTVVVTGGSPGLLTRGLVTASRTFAAAGTYTVTVTVTDDDGLSSQDSLQVIVGGDDPVGACLPDIDFDRGLSGNALPAGTIVSDQWALWGVHVTTDDPANHPAMIFDSAHPTGGDDDLASPAGMTLGNILIISEDANSSNPDDNAAGGSLIFTFDNPVQLDEVTLLDIDTNETATVTLRNAAGGVIVTQTLGGTGNNSLLTVTLDADNVAEMVIELSASGAVTGLVFCRDLPSMSLSGDAGAIEGSPYNIQMLSPDVAITSWQLNFADGSTQVITGDEPTATTTFDDGPATAVIGGWATNGKDFFPVQPFGVAVENVVPTLTISGDASVEAGTAYTLDLSAIDPGNDSIQGWVIAWGDGTIEQITGNPSSVTHTYQIDGDYSVIAHAFDEDYDGPTVGRQTVIEVAARGDEGGEAFDVLVDDVVIGSGVASTVNQTFAFAATGAVAASQIKIRFNNDLYDPAAGVDRNLKVDFITVGGKTFQTEAHDVYSTGTWKSTDGTVPGYRGSEYLHSNGFFRYDADANDGSVVTVNARGDEGGETFDLIIDGVRVGAYTTTTANQAFTYRSGLIVSADQVRIEFTNDVYNPSAGIDRNLIVDSISIDGVTYQTEDPSVYSTGTWKPADGITPGYRESEWLHGSGYFQFAAPQDTLPLAGGSDAVAAGEGLQHPGRPIRQSPPTASSPPPGSRTPSTSPSRPPVPSGYPTSTSTSTNRASRSPPATASPTSSPRSGSPSRRTTPTVRR